MYIIIWEYLRDFEKIYGGSGTWVELFQKANGYFGTELLRNSGDSRGYITIDRWDSRNDHESFLSKWKKDYEQLDAQCIELTEHELYLGSFESDIDR